MSIFRVEIQDNSKVLNPRLARLRALAELKNLSSHFESHGFGKAAKGSLPKGAHSPTGVSWSIED